MKVSAEILKIANNLLARGKDDVLDISETVEPRPHVKVRGRIPFPGDDITDDYKSYGPGPRVHEFDMRPLDDVSQESSIHPYWKRMRDIHTSLPDHLKTETVHRDSLVKPHFPQDLSLKSPGAKHRSDKYDSVTVPVGEARVRNFIKELTRRNPGSSSK